MFLINLLLPSSGYTLRMEGAGSLGTSLTFYNISTMAFEDGVSRFLWNFGISLPEYTASHPTRQQCSSVCVVSIGTLWRMTVLWVYGCHSWACGWISSHDSSPRVCLARARPVFSIPLPLYLCCDGTATAHAPYWHGPTLYQPLPQVAKSICAANRARHTLCGLIYGEKIFVLPLAQQKRADIAY